MRGPTQTFEHGQTRTHIMKRRVEHFRPGVRVRVKSMTRDPNTVLALLALPSKGRVIYL
jgi:hypothetical protein